MYELALTTNYGLTANQAYILVISTKLHPTTDGFTYGKTSGPGMYGMKTNKDLMLEVYDN